MARKTFPLGRRSIELADYDFNLPTALRNAGYHFDRIFGGFALVDHKGNIVKEWYVVPSLTELFDFAKAL